MTVQDNIAYLRLAKELTGSTDLDALFHSASRIAQYVAGLSSPALVPQSIVDFAKEMKVEHPIKGPIDFVPYPYQEEYLTCLASFEHGDPNIVLAKHARQMGFSTMLGIYALFEACQKRDQVIVVIAHKLAQTEALLDRMRMISHTSKASLVSEYTKRSISFTNGSLIIVRAANDNAIRGLRPTHILMDEAAWISYKSLDAVLEQTWCASANETVRIVIQTTPKYTEGPFWELWSSRSKAVRLSYNWKHHPERDEAWVKRYRDTLGAVGFAQEMDAQFTSPLARTSVPTSRTSD